LELAPNPPPSEVIVENIDCDPLVATEVALTDPLPPPPTVTV
jgi:hypothetical protein